MFRTSLQTVTEEESVLPETTTVSEDMIAIYLEVQNMIYHKQYGISSHFEKLHYYAHASHLDIVIHLEALAKMGDLKLLLATKIFYENQAQGITELYDSLGFYNEFKDRLIKSNQDSEFLKLFLEMSYENFNECRTLFDNFLAREQRKLDQMWECRNYIKMKWGELKWKTHYYDMTK